MPQSAVWLNVNKSAEPCWGCITSDVVTIWGATLQVSTKLNSYCLRASKAKNRTKANDIHGSGTGKLRTLLKTLFWNRHWWKKKGLLGVGKGPHWSVKKVRALVLCFVWQGKRIGGKICRLPLATRQSQRRRDKAREDKIQIRHFTNCIIQVQKSRSTTTNCFENKWPFQ